MLRRARGADAKSIQVTSLPDLGEQPDGEQQGEDDDEEYRSEGEEEAIEEE